MEWDRQIREFKKKVSTETTIFQSPDKEDTLTQDESDSKPTQRKVYFMFTERSI